MDGQTNWQTRSQSVYLLTCSRCLELVHALFLPAYRVTVCLLSSFLHFPALTLALDGLNLLMLFFCLFAWLSAYLPVCPAHSPCDGKNLFMLFSHLPASLSLMPAPSSLVGTLQCSPLPSLYKFFLSLALLNSNFC